MTETIGAQDGCGVRTDHADYSTSHSLGKGRDSCSFMLSVESSTTTDFTAFLRKGFSYFDNVLSAEPIYHVLVRFHIHLKAYGSLSTHHAIDLLTSSSRSQARIYILACPLQSRGWPGWRPSSSTCSSRSGCPSWLQTRASNRMLAHRVSEA